VDNHGHHVGDSCSGLTGDDLTVCQAGQTGQTGTAIGTLMVVAFWAFIDVILGVVYVVTRLARRRPK